MTFAIEEELIGFIPEINTNPTPIPETKGSSRFWQRASLLFMAVSLTACGTPFIEGKMLPQLTPTPSPTAEPPKPLVSPTPAGTPVPYTIIPMPECLPTPNLTPEERANFLRDGKDLVFTLDYLTNQDILDNLKSPLIDSIRDVVTGKIDPKTIAYDEALCDTLAFLMYTYSVESKYRNHGINTQADKIDSTILFKNPELRRVYGLVQNIGLDFYSIYTDETFSQLKELRIVFTTGGLNPNNNPIIEPGQLDNMLALWLKPGIITNITKESEKHIYMGMGWEKEVESRILKGETTEFMVEAKIDTFGQTVIYLRPKGQH